ncbi:cytochrome P450 [Syncephalastrum racemosum]|uniref:Cytochrome P450 n=1 Tax=Syncephalastrum racemosum TaxID=13706 RepID=A0A1X2HBR6_SYNRA|nr:cytochrome P450 [Syncephalastrum racemosum]
MTDNTIVNTALSTVSGLFREPDQRKTALAIILALLSTYTASRLVRTKEESQHHVPFVSGSLPVLGHTIQMERAPREFLARCKERYGSAFAIRLAGQNFYVLTGNLIPELFRAGSKAFSFTEGIETLVPTQRVIDVSYGHKFQPERMNPRDKHPIIYPIKHNFKEDQIHVFSERIQAGLEHALAEQLTLAPGESKTVQGWDFLAKAISHISCLCFAGSDVGRDPRLVSAMATFTQKIIKAGMALSIMPAWLGDWYVRRYMSVTEELDLVMELVVPDLIKRQQSGELGTGEPAFTAMALSLQRSDGTFRSVQDAAFYFKNIALASIHTTSHFATFALHELACRPHLVAELRQELNGVRLTPESIIDLPLLDSFLREVLRFNVDILSMHHRALHDVVLSNGMTVPKGSLVVAAVEDWHFGAEPIGPTPLDHFDAHRFLSVDLPSSTIAEDFVTFGFGAHACPGRYFAVNEIKYVLAELIMRYDISTKLKTRAPDHVLLGMTKFPPREPLIFTGREA